MILKAVQDMDLISLSAFYVCLCFFSLHVLPYVAAAFNPLIQQHSIQTCTGLLTLT